MAKNAYTDQISSRTSLDYTMLDYINYNVVYVMYILFCSIFSYFLVWGMSGVGLLLSKIYWYLTELWPLFNV